MPQIKPLNTKSLKKLRRTSWIILILSILIDGASYNRSFPSYNCMIGLWACYCGHYRSALTRDNNFESGRRRSVNASVKNVQERDKILKMMLVFAVVCGMTLVLDLVFCFLWGVQIIKGHHTSLKCAIVLFILNMLVKTSSIFFASQILMFNQEPRVPHQIDADGNIVNNESKQGITNNDGLNNIGDEVEYTPGSHQTLNNIHAIDLREKNNVLSRFKLGGENGGRTSNNTECRKNLEGSEVDIMMSTSALPNPPPIVVVRKNVKSAIVSDADGFAMSPIGSPSRTSPVKPPLVTSWMS